MLDLPQVHLFFILDLSPSKSAYVRIWSHLFGVGSIFRAFFLFVCFCILNIDLYAISDAILLGKNCRKNCNTAKIAEVYGKSKSSMPNKLRVIDSLGIL